MLDEKEIGEIQAGCSSMCHAYRDIAVLLGDRRQLIDALMDMVIQHCSTREIPTGKVLPGRYDSIGLTANAVAMKLLIECGWLEITTGVGRCVIATVKD